MIVNPSDKICIIQTNKSCFVFDSWDYYDEDEELLRYVDTGHLARAEDQAAYMRDHIGAKRARRDVLFVDP